MNPAEFANIAAAEEHFWWYRGMRQILFRLLDPIARARKFQRILEAGCGTGHLAKQLALRYGWHVTAVDMGAEGLDWGRKMGLSLLAQADIAALPFPNATFDCTISMDVIVHFPRGEEWRAMSELSRVTRPGGFFAIRVSALDVLRSRHSEFAHERQRFTKSRLERLARRYGVRVLRSSYVNSLLMPVALAKFRLWEPLMTSRPDSGVKPVPPLVDRLLYAPLAAEARWLGAGFNFPAGQSLILLGERDNSPHDKHRDADPAHPDIASA